MTEQAKAMINMAESIAKINNAEIERMNLQKSHFKDSQFDHYNVTVRYSDGKEITIREDCTIL